MKKYDGCTCSFKPYIHKKSRKILQKLLSTVVVVSTLRIKTQNYTVYHRPRNIVAAESIQKAESIRKADMARGVSKTFFSNVFSFEAFRDVRES